MELFKRRFGLTAEVNAEVTVAQAFLYLHSAMPSSQRSQSVLTSLPSCHGPCTFVWARGSWRLLFRNGIKLSPGAAPSVYSIPCGVAAGRCPPDKNSMGGPKPFQSNHATLCKEHLSWTGTQVCKRYIHTSAHLPKSRIKCTTEQAHESLQNLNIYFYTI